MCISSFPWNTSNGVKRTFHAKMSNHVNINKAIASYGYITKSEKNSRGPEVQSMTLKQVSIEIEISLKQVSIEIEMSLELKMQ